MKLSYRISVFAFPACLLFSSCAGVNLYTKADRFIEKSSPSLNTGVTDTFDISECAALHCIKNNRKLDEQQLEKAVNIFRDILENINKDVKRRDWESLKNNDQSVINYVSFFRYIFCNSVEICSVKIAEGYTGKEIGKLNYRNSEIDLNRIQQWEHMPDQNIKLRIVSAELSYQIKRWVNKRKQKINNPATFCSVISAFDLFCRIYFQLDVPTQGLDITPTIFYER